MQRFQLCSIALLSLLSCVLNAPTKTPSKVTFCQALSNASNVTNVTTKDEPVYKTAIKSCTRLNSQPEIKQETFLCKEVLTLAKKICQEKQTFDMENWIPVSGDPCPNYSKLLSGIPDDKFLTINGTPSVVLNLLKNADKCQEVCLSDEMRPVCDLAVGLYVNRTAASVPNKDLKRMHSQVLNLYKETYMIQEKIGEVSDAMDTLKEDAKNISVKYQQLYDHVQGGTDTRNYGIRYVGSAADVEITATSESPLEESPKETAEETEKNTKNERDDAKRDSGEEHRQIEDDLPPTMEDSETTSTTTRPEITKGEPISEETSVKTAADILNRVLPKTDDSKNADPPISDNKDGKSNGELKNDKGESNHNNDEHAKNEKREPDIDDKLAKTAKSGPETTTNLNTQPTESRKKATSTNPKPSSFKPPAENPPAPKPDEKTQKEPKDSKDQPQKPETALNTPKDASANAQGNVEGDTLPNESPKGPLSNNDETQAKETKPKPELSQGKPNEETELKPPPAATTTTTVGGKTKPVEPNVPDTKDLNAESAGMEDDKEGEPQDEIVPPGTKAGEAPLPNKDPLISDDETGDGNFAEDENQEKDVPEPAGDKALGGAERDPEDTQHDSSLDKKPITPVFPEQEDSHFFAYFLTVIVVIILAYLVVHNKQKILGLIVEGRGGQRRRSHSYRKLDTESAKGSQMIF